MQQIIDVSGLYEQYNSTVSPVKKAKIKSRMLKLQYTIFDRLAVVERCKMLDEIDFMAEGLIQ